MNSNFETNMNTIAIISGVDLHVLVHWEGKTFIKVGTFFYLDKTFDGFLLLFYILGFKTLVEHGKQPNNIF